MENVFYGQLSRFIALTDTPSSYSGQAGKALRVNVGEDALEFVVDAAVGAGVNAGEMMFWNGSAWDNTETTEIEWNDTTKVLNLANMPTLVGVAIDGGDIVNTPAGDIIATDVQAAIDELDTEKVSIANLALTTIGTAGCELVGISAIGTPTFTTQCEVNSLFGSTGRATGGVTTDAGGETIDISAGAGFIKATDSDTADLLSMDWAASSAVAVPTDTRRYTGIVYNSGTPITDIRTAELYDLDTEFPLASIVNEGGTLHILNNPWWVTDGLTNIIERFRADGYIVRDKNVGGLALSVPGTRNVAVTTGTLWSNLNEFVIPALDTNVTGTVEIYYRSGASAWTDADVSQYPITQYNRLSDNTLQTIGNNKYFNWWVYAEADDTEVAMVYPQAEYVTSAGAEAESPPTSIPPHIAAHAILIGRILCQQGVDAPVQVDSAWETTFTASQAADHGNLAGLGDDDHTQYARIDQSTSPQTIGTTGDRLTKLWTVDLEVTNAIALADGSTATTQSASDNSTKLATTAYADAAGSGLAWGGSINGDTSSTGLTLTVDNSSTAGNAQEITIGNTQTNVITGLDINTGTSAVGHIGALIDAKGASVSQRGLKIDMGSTGTGIHIELVGGAAAAGLGAAIKMTDDGSGNLPANFLAGDSAPMNSNLNVDHRFAYYNISSTLASARTTNYLHLEQQHTGVTSGTFTDNYDLGYFKRTTGTSGAATITSQGSVIYGENSVGATGGGSITDTVNVLELVQDADSTGYPIKITQNAIVSTNFKKCIDAGGVTIWISDGTTPNGNLSGTAGDICLNGASSQSFFCTGTTNWTGM